MKRGKVFAPEPDECGIWLDTAELKEKKKKPKRICPITQLLNPLAGGGYSIQVALNFTQNKHPLPITKQTTISSFFTAKCTDSKNNKSQDADSDDSDFKSLPSSQSGWTGRKRKYCSDRNDINLSIGSVDTGETSISVLSTPQMEDNDCLKQEKYSQRLRCDRDSSLSNDDTLHTKITGRLLLSMGDSSELLGWRNGQPVINTALDAVDCTASEASEEHMFSFQDGFAEAGEISTETGEASLTRCTFTQDSQGNRVIAHRTPQPAVPKKPILDNEGSQLWLTGDTESLSTERFFHTLLRQGGYTSTQKRIDCFKSQKTPQPVNSTFNESQEIRGDFGADKENKCSSDPLITWKRRGSVLGQSPLKGTQQDKGLWSSPKRARVQKTLANTQALLFTQDTQGNRVIAHRRSQGWTCRSPLKDQTNWSQSRNWDSPIKSPISHTSLHEVNQSNLDFDLEPDLLFTQDSEGNTVIKHQ
ncbi:aurora kinase A- and ninein-interacting protein [Amia ocellicauda]|uniref:aurora kinase A- and ninein-interacting protein n=1 Tax=Amia ocellicauda TaxID=2972642 RepID=UPI003464A35E